MTQEAIRMRAGEDDRMDVRIAVCAINQFFQLFGDRGIKQRMRAAVDTSDKYAGVALNINVSCGLRVHTRSTLSVACSGATQVLVGRWFSLRICLSKARAGTKRRRALTRPAREPAV